MSQGSETGTGAAEIRIGIGSALVIALAVMGTFGAGFGLLHNEISSLRSDMREDHEAMRIDIAALQVSVGRLEVRMGHVEQRLDGVEQRLDGVEQRLGGVEQRLGIQPPDDPAEIP